MANQQSHISFSLVIAVAYAGFGFVAFRILPEYIVLASIVIVISGLLPDVDAGGEAPARELGGLLAAVSPLLLIEYFPSLKAGGVARMTLVVVCCYLLTRILVVRLLQNLTVHRGMIHSIPAAIITFEVVYLLFWELKTKTRLFVSLAALVGYLSHLVLDAYGNLDILGKAMGKAQKKPAVLKLFAPSGMATVIVYLVMFTLGWFVAKDVYPHLQVHAKVIY